MKDESSVQYEIYRKDKKENEQYCYYDLDENEENYSFASWGVEPTRYDTLEEVQNIIAHAKEYEGSKWTYYICKITITHTYDEA